jgi:hypothetical protein
VRISRLPDARKEAGSDCVLTLVPSLLVPGQVRGGVLINPSLKHNKALSQSPTVLSSMTYNSTEKTAKTQDSFNSKIKDIIMRNEAGGMLKNK